MHETGLALRRESLGGRGIRYGYDMEDRSAGRGTFSVSDLCKKLPDAGLLQVDLRDNVTLTPRGHEFARWLIENGKKASYFHCDLGTWGTSPANHPIWGPASPSEHSPGEEGPDGPKPNDAP
jgi:hypothetical protein